MGLGWLWNFNLLQPRKVKTWNPARKHSMRCLRTSFQSTSPIPSFFFPLNFLQIDRLRRFLCLRTHDWDLVHSFLHFFPQFLSVDPIHSLQHFFPRTLPVDLVYSTLHCLHICICSMYCTCTYCTTTTVPTSRKKNGKVRARPRNATITYFNKYLVSYTTTEKGRRIASSWVTLTGETRLGLSHTYCM